MLRVLSMALLAALLATAPAVPVAAQSLLGTDPGSSVRTRADLERLLAEYESAMASTVYSASVREGLRVDAELIRTRLRNGDFRVGDRITLTVQGEPDLPDTLTVEAGPKVILPVFGEISVAGVLRSEIQQHFTTELRRFITNPVVQAKGHIRISVLGEIIRPGFYTMPADILLGEAIMVAGGPTGSSNIEGIRIDRGPTTVLAGEALQEAVRNGLTLDQLNMQAGDQIVVPGQSTSDFWGRVAIIAGVVGSLSVVLLQLF